MTRHFFEGNSSAVIICHRVEIPPHAGCLEDRRGTTAATCRHGVETAGGVSLDTPNVVAVNLVSGRKDHDNGPSIGTCIAQILTATTASPG